MDEVAVPPRNCDCDQAIGLAMYMWNGFLDFFRHESTQIIEYNKGIVNGHAVHWEDNQRKMFLLIVSVLNVFIFIFHQASRFYIGSFL